MLARRTLLVSLAGLPAACAKLDLSPVLAARRGVTAIQAVDSGALLGVDRADEAALLLARPGSTMKPFSLVALLQSGKLRPKERYVCPGRLRLLGRHLDCSHEPAKEPFDVVAALAYSCNCFVANAASRFANGELASHLERFGFGAPTHLAAKEASGLVERLGGERQQVQAIGEDGVFATPLMLLAAYRQLARLSRQPTRETACVFEGLEAAVAAGTAQLARMPGLKVAGKTGTATTRTPGQRFAWFAGYAPADKAEAAVVALIAHGSGGADAAPAAAAALRIWRGSRG